QAGVDVHCEAVGGPSMRAYAAMLLVAVVATAPVVGAPAPLPRPGASARPADPEKHLYDCLGKGEAFTHSGLTLRAKRVKGRTLLGVTLQVKDGNGEVDFIAQAEEGEVRVGKDSKTLHLRLLRGEGVTSEGSRGSFEERRFKLFLAAPL